MVKADEYGYLPPPAMASGDAAPGVKVPGGGAQEGRLLDPSGKYVLRYQGAFAAVECKVGANDGLKAQGGVMVTLSSNVDIDAKIEGSAGRAFCMGCCANESFFFSHFRLRQGAAGPGDVLLAPGVPGDIFLLHLDGGERWAIQKGAFLGADQSVDMGIISQGVSKGCCSGMGFFILEASGVGRLLLASYGSVVRYDVAAGEVRTIDNGFVVAWTTRMSYSVGTAASSLSSSLLSGEGFVTRFEGPGTVYVQTRSIKSLARALQKYLPAGGGGGGGG